MIRDLLGDFFNELAVPLLLAVIGLGGAAIWFRISYGFWPQ